MHAEDQFHVGIVVEDLGHAQVELTALAGYVWGTEIASTMPVRLPTWTGDLPIRLVYSVSLPRVELVEQIPGTVWQLAAGSGLHHLGYWSDDIAADAAHLEARGYDHEASGLDPDGHPMWSFHRSQRGPRIELVSRALEPLMSSMWAIPGQPPQ
jgi:hypothetical protein